MPRKARPRAKARAQQTVTVAAHAAARPAAAALRPGDAVAGRYVTVRLLGRGGMGEVHEVEDRDFGIRVALKTIRSDKACTEDSLRAFKREVLVARQVTHRNVCRLHDIGRDPRRDLTFCTMELLPGETLRTRLRRNGPLPLGETLGLLRQVAWGVDAAHAAGIVHRDLKTSNAMVVPSTEGERVVVTDFGLALPESAADAEAGRISGTPGYMAPEQLRGERVGPAADVYALGVMLFEAVTGRLPFEGDSAWEAAQRKLDEDAPAASDFARELPAAWNDAICRCLSRDAKARFPSAGEAIAALAGEAPPASGGLRLRGRVPAETNAFVGRDAEIQELDRKVQPGGLVTLLGPAGAGKTRLAGRHARSRPERWPGGAWFCDLTDARDLDALVTAVAGALEVTLAPRDPVEQVGHALAARGRCLVVLDNFEQVAPHAAASVGAWRERAPEAAFVVTSRQRLGLRGEDVVDVGPLDAEPGVALFLERAAASRPGFVADAGDVDEIRRLVRSLDGLPLAIELAAARARTMAPAQIAERLMDRFRLLTGGPTGRHRTLQAAIDSSWELLAEWERAAFAQCSVFEGGFTLDAAEDVLDLSAWPDAPWVVDVVHALLDRSLLRVDAVGGRAPRLSLLTSLQDYARGRLSGEEAARAEAAHGKHFGVMAGAVVEEARHAAGRGGQRVRALAADVANVVAASRRAAARGDAELAARTFVATWAVLRSTGPFTLVADLGHEALASGPRGSTRALALRALGGACLHSGRMADAEAFLREALDLQRNQGDRLEEATLLTNLGELHAAMNRPGEALAEHEAALRIFASLGTRVGEGIALGCLGTVLVRLGRVDEARTSYERALAIARETGARETEGIVLADLGLLDVPQGRLAEARENLERSLAIQRELGNRRVEANVLGGLVGVLHHEGRTAECRARAEEALAIHRETGNRHHEAIVLANMGQVLEEQGRLDEARAAIEQALPILRQIGDKRIEAVAAANLGVVASRQGRAGEAVRLLEQAIALAREIGSRRHEAGALAALGGIWLDAGDVDAARSCLETAETILRGQDERLSLGEVLCTRARLASRTGADVEARRCLAEAGRIAEEAGLGAGSTLRREIDRLGREVG